MTKAPYGFKGSYYIAQCDNYVLAVIYDDHDEIEYEQYSNTREDAMDIIQTYYGY